MGCDIHFCIEKKVTTYKDGDRVPVEPVRWVGVYSTYETPLLISDSEPMPSSGTPIHGLTFYGRYSAMRRRNYDFFASLAGVRGDGPEPKGFPNDASELAWMMTNPEEDDDHSHSWDTLEDFAHKWILRQKDETVAASVANTLLGGDGLIEHVVGLWDNVHLYRVVYWFDN